MYAWHFLKADRRLAYPPHTPVVVGQELTVDPDKLELCTYGLHASVRALDALGYAPGPVICRVKLGGRILEGNDKICASERTVIAMANAAKTLRAFARSCALDVIDNWAAPAVVREYLETGNEDLRSAAWAASESAAESAAAEAAARSAAWSAVWAATRSAAWAASESARSAAWSVARSAESAARSSQNERLEAMLSELLGLNK